jgi:hypothetical protein
MQSLACQLLTRAGWPDALQMLSAFCATFFKANRPESAEWLICTTQFNKIRRYFTGLLTGMKFSTRLISERRDEKNSRLMIRHALYPETLRERDGYGAEHL